MTLHLQQNEHILIKRRKHWLILIQKKIGTILAGLVPAIIGIFLFSTGIIPLQDGTMALWLYAISAWLLIIVMALATIWTTYYLDIWIVTNRRIIHIDQVGIFNRKVSSLSIERVQDVTTKQSNFLETIFNFGTLRVQTAGALHEFTVMDGISRPTEVSRIIMKQIGRSHVMPRSPHSPRRHDS